ncbi:pentapeptide repeat-containing protein [Actinoplanes sp. NPDC051513]|uniref:pentapeptide repeat-containing protein n=1 Tax=Actinoplanes sp. NPDC051513 TaxID=3363908 RepID=UPI0037A388FE
MGLVLTNQATNEQLKLARSDQSAKRFTDAVGQLGQEDQRKGDKLSIRMGAIYALTRLMQDSPEYQPAVVNILSAFVNTHGPAIEEPGTAIPPTADVEAAFMAVAHRPDGRIPILPGSFSGVQLTVAAAQLHGAFLARADLSSAYLVSADLSAADLNGSVLTDATLVFANLSGANLTGARLRRSLLGNANLVGSNLSGADLIGANIVGADLSRTNVKSDQLICVKTDKRTRLPVGVAPKSQMNTPLCSEMMTS